MESECNMVPNAGTVSQLWSHGTYRGCRGSFVIKLNMNDDDNDDDNDDKYNDDDDDTEKVAGLVGNQTPAPGIGIRRLV